MLEVLRSRNNKDFYLFDPSIKGIHLKGGSSFVYKGFTFSSLKKKVPRGISFQDLENCFLEKKIIPLFIEKLFFEEYENKGIGLIQLLYALPLDFVAIKVLKKNLHNKEMYRLWENEIKFNIEHENLIKLYEAIDIDIKTQNGTYPIRHLVTEWVDAPILSESYSNINSFSEINTIFNQLLDGVESIHVRNKIHRDIKPDNIMFKK